jgi:hypothetical protein
MLQFANLALRFFLELGALAGLGYWGFRTGASSIAKIGLGLGAPLLMAVVWGLFIAPKALIPAPTGLRVLLELVVFGSAVLALVRAGQPVIAGVFALLVIVNEILLFVWKH